MKRIIVKNCWRCPYVSKAQESGRFMVVCGIHNKEVPQLKKLEDTPEWCTLENHKDEDGTG